MEPSTRVQGKWAEALRSRIMLFLYGVLVGGTIVTLMTVPVLRKQSSVISGFLAEREELQKSVTQTDSFLSAQGLAVPADASMGISVSRKAALDLALLSAQVSGERRQLQTYEVMVNAMRLQADKLKSSGCANSSGREALAAILDLLRPGLGKLVAQ